MENVGDVLVGADGEARDEEQAEAVEIKLSLDEPVERVSHPLMIA